MRESLADLAIFVIHRRRQGGVAQCHSQPSEQQGDEDRCGATECRTMGRQQVGSYVSYRYHTCTNCPASANYVKSLPQQCSHLAP